MKDMRRQEKEIKDVEEIKKVLYSTKYITIAMCDKNMPYLVTLSHGYDPENNCIYFHCASQGKKIDILKANDNVWGSTFIDLGYVHGKCDHLYSSVHFKGRVVFVKDLNEKRHALEIMIRQLEKNPEQVMAKQMAEDSVRKVMIGRIDIVDICGKKSKDVIVSI